MCRLPQERSGIDRIVRLLREVGTMQEAMEDMRQGHTSKWGLALTALTSGRLMGQYKDATMAQFLDTCTQDVRLRAVVMGQTGDYGIAPSEVSTLLHCGLAGHYFKGAYYPKGGGQRLSDRLAEVVEANGGSIHLRRPIDRIDVSGGRVTGVTTAARGRQAAYSVGAKVVVSAADLSRTLIGLLGPEHLPDGMVQKVSTWQNAEGLLNTCLAVDVPSHELKSKFGMRVANYWCFDDFDTEKIYQAVRDAPKATGSFGCYITSASLKDPTSTHHAPEGQSTVEVLTVVPQASSPFQIYQGPSPSRYRRPITIFPSSGFLQVGCDARGGRERRLPQEHYLPRTQERH